MIDKQTLIKLNVIARSIWVLINPTEKKPEHIKNTNNIRNNGEKPQDDRANNGTIASKDSVIIVGDMLIKNVIFRVIFRDISRYKP